MEYKLDKGCHSVYALQFHLVMCVQYRKKILTGMLDERLKGLVGQVAEHFKVQILQQETDKDHIHILFSGRPSLSISRFINSLKSVTSRKLRQEFPQVMKKHLWGGVFWSPSYFLATTGQVTLETIRHYVETQKEQQQD
ncbi:MAG TPA: IS200/IS605 family transposase [Dissulfurispiraceae bacterium]|nr:IS200/IS605 family transposase [Dissulfurispiraceae bacterium]